MDDTKTIQNFTEGQACKVAISIQRLVHCESLELVVQLYIGINQIVTNIIIHQIHNQKSDWSRAFNQFTIACEFDMINAISAADIAFIMSSSTFAWLLSPLECSPQKQNG